MFKCKQCNSENIRLACWVNPNTREVDPNKDALFDLNEGPGNVEHQWCDSCDSSCELFREEPATHQADPTGVMRQVVSPQQLREILDAQGRPHTKPMFFRNCDEWRVS